ncbi:MAG: hypothetical protein N3E39_02995 [Candidatus Methanomethylicia archaeon]|nr:hypothetical protein [Candidatus Methanomethylicia archaeon]
MSKYRIASISLRLLVITINLCIFLLLSLSFYTFSMSFKTLFENIDQNVNIISYFDNSTKEYVLKIDLNIVNSGLIDLTTKFNGYISTVDGSIVKSSSSSSIIKPRDSSKLSLIFRFTESELLKYRFDLYPPYLNIELEFRTFSNLIGLKFHIGEIAIRSD